MASKSDRKQQRKTMKFGAPRSSGPKPQQSRHKKPSKKVADNLMEDTLHDEKICVLCCEEIEILAKGSCDHVVCFKCSSRMRVLCEEKYCAICRMDLDKVAFIEDHIPYKDLTLTNMPKITKHGIFFQNDHVKSLYEELLFYSCPVCVDKANFGSFNELRRHVRQVHDKQYCDLCSKNLKIFPKELRIYTRSELVAHRKSGDPDDKSYKGHPQCEFCSQRYLDNDELLDHLRKNHFWCHFCEKDGRQDYFATYDFLREHFREEHFLCEENECVHEKFTAAFRSDIDYQAHKLAKHSKKMSKVAAKQARQLNVDIDYGTRKQQQQKALAEKRFASDQRNYVSQNDRTGDGESSLDGGRGSMLAGGSSDISPSMVAQNGKTQDLGIPSFQNEFPILNKDTHPVALVHPPGLRQASTADATSHASESSTASTSATTADVLKGRGGKGPALLAGSVDQQGSLSWSQFSNNINLGCQEAFPSLDGGSNAKPQPTNYAVTFKHAASGRKKDGTMVADATKDATANGLATLAINPTFKSKQSPKTQKKHASPPGIRKQNVKSATVAKAIPPPGIPKLDSQKATSPKSVHNPIKSTQERNMELVELIRNLLSSNDFAMFKDLSGSFRRSEINASQYYDCIFDLLGHEFDLVFLELVDLLPDQTKQQQLLDVYNLRFDTRNNLKERDKCSKKKLEESNQSPVNRSELSQKPKQNVKTKATMNDKDLVSCNICGISLSKKQAKTHMDIHVENDFPELPISASVGKPKFQSWQTKPQKSVRNAWNNPK
eukprot:gene9365-10352_t